MLKVIPLRKSLSRAFIANWRHIFAEKSNRYFPPSSGREENARDGIPRKVPWIAAATVPE